MSPQTGPAAGFGEPDPYIIGLVQAKLDQGFAAGGKDYAVTIVQKDGKSDPATAAQVANDLINTDKVDMILGDVDAGEQQPDRRCGRGRRRALHLDRRAMGSLLLPAPEGPGQAGPLQVHLSLQLRRRRVRQDVHLDVG